MSRQVKLVQRIPPDGDMEDLVIVSFKEGESLFTFRSKLEDTAQFETPFAFWDHRIPGPVRVKMEKLVFVEDLEGKVIVFETKDFDSTGRPRLTESPSDPLSIPIPPPTNLGSPLGPLLTQESAASNPQSESPSDSAEPVHSFLSKLMPPAIEEIWKTQAAKYSRYADMVDHRWRVKTWDEGEHVHATIECLECHCFNGTEALDSRKILNTFVNFRTKHIGQTSKHHDNWCRRRNLRSTRVPKKDITVATMDAKAEVDLGVGIVERLNGSLDIERKPFVVEGDVNQVPCIVFQYRVRCVYCGIKFELVPKQRNLEHNLRQHLGAQRHMENVKADLESIVGPVRTGSRGRPRKVDGRDTKRQKSIKDFCGSSKSSSSQVLEPDEAGQLMGVDVVLSSLCWGFHFSSFSVTQKNNIIREVPVKCILDDQTSGELWYSEPHCRGLVYNPTQGQLVNVEGTFRHRECSKITKLGGGFKDLCCLECFEISKILSFRKRCLREVEAPEKRGFRSTDTHIRVDYLTNSELRKQAQLRMKSRRRERFLLFSMRRRICSLSTRKCRLSEMLGEAVNRKDLILFFRNICSAHRSGAFGGKEALWEFMQDCGRNINRKSQGHRFSKKTKAISQALMQFGGRQVVNCMSLNLLSPSLRTLKRDRAKLLPFQAGVNATNFSEVGRILAEAKRMNGILGDVPVILAEDETRIKPRVRWEAKRDTLIGFCGSSGEHSCSFGLEVTVGSGEDGYATIVNTFENCIRGSYARVIIVNPLHERLPKLAVCASVTCNTFSAEWVRQHWCAMKSMWDKECRPIVGPVIGHASDGDSRRRKLMLEDFSCSDGSRYGVDWEGWIFTARVLENGDVYGMGDQDPPHNGKKLVNPLDRSTDPLALGGFHACLEHVHTVYRLYTVDLHGLTLDDVKRRDRQNWAGPQRICSRRVQKCLMNLAERADSHRERTLGTCIYLEVVADYLDIFYSPVLDIHARVVKCAKVSFFFRLWRLWLKKGNHFVCGNTQAFSQKNFVSLECHLDVQMSCHMVVLLCCVFRDIYPGLPVPFHLVGSDCCEHFFSKVGGMRGHERNYDFGELLDCASGLNKLAVLQYGEEKLKLGNAHFKQDHIWGKLHPLKDGEVAPDLTDFSRLATNSEIVLALRTGFAEAQQLCIRLQMAPAPGVKELQWWKTPWVVEKQLWVKDKVVLANAPSNAEVDCIVDGEGAVDISLWNAVRTDPDDPSLAEDGVDDFDIAAHEFRHVMAELHSDGSSPSSEKIDCTVSFEGKVIHKSTLVSQLVGNPTLSKDRLTRIKQSVYFNVANPKPREPGTACCFLDIGSDCGVWFENVVPSSLPTRTRGKRKGGSSTGRTVQEVWVGRVQKIRRKYNGTWGKCRTEIDLLDRPIADQASEGSICQILFNWFAPMKGSRTKFMFNNNDLQWIDVEMVVAVVTMKMQNALRDVWCLDANDRKVLDDFKAAM